MPWGCPLIPPCGDPSPIPSRLPLLPCRCTLFPIEVPRHCCSLFRWETSPSPPSALQKNPNQKPEERNKQTNPFPLLAWHLLAVLPLLIREAAGIISNKPLLMKFRAADPGGAPRHRFSETLIKFTARRCFQLGWRQSGEAARARHGCAGGGAWGEGCWWERGTPLCCSPQGHLVLSGFGSEQRDQLGCATAKGVLPGHRRDGESGSFNSLIKLTEWPVGRVPSTA